MKQILLVLALSATLPALAQQAPQSNTVGDNSKVDQQIIGDTTSTADHTNSVSTQLGNSANNNGASIDTKVDTRDQNTNNVSSGANAFGNQSDNKSSATASNGNQTLGQANTGNSTIGNTTSSSGGNVLGGASATTGPNANLNTNTNAGGSATTNGSNVGINGQEQGINHSGNADVKTSNSQGQSSANRNTQNTSAGNGAGSGNMTSNTTNVDAADRSSTNYRATAWAPVILGQAAPALAAGNVIIYPGQCGPRHELRKIDVTTTHHGVIWDSEKKQGFDYSIVPAEHPFIERGEYLMGHQVIEYTAIIGTSSGGSFSLGGFGSGGQAAQGGAASNGQVQQIVQRVSLRECVYATRKTTPEIEIKERVILREVPVKKPLE
ncbi:hypothetical protein [Acinetobacter sp.]|uniref:hypothetical protein n=1 Tax=Acinetobacter sp. TaxID=472 RepID=UPI003890C68B